VAGPHCYAFYAGEDAIAAMMAEEPARSLSPTSRRRLARSSAASGPTAFPELRNNCALQAPRLSRQREDPEPDPASGRRRGAARPRFRTPLHGAPARRARVVGSRDGGDGTGEGRTKTQAYRISNPQ